MKSNPVYLEIYNSQLLQKENETMTKPGKPKQQNKLIRSPREGVPVLKLKSQRIHKTGNFTLYGNI
jgi:hypothetical protein